MKKPRADFRAMLDVLAAHGVEFIIVGGVAAVLQGTPIATFDLDIVHSRTSLNIERLLAALGEIEAFYRGQGTRRLQPDATHLASAGHQLLLTVHGPLDLLGAIGAGRTYETLLGSTEEVVLESLRLRVLALPMLIESKEEAGREKDRAVLSILRRTLEERDKR